MLVIDVIANTFGDHIIKTIKKVKDENGNVIEASDQSEVQYISFRNKYEAADTSVTLKATKSLTGRNWSDGDAFTFKIEATGDNAEDAPVPASDTVRATKTNQTVSFGAITYESEGTWTYQVTEPAGSAGGVTYDETVYAVEVTVTDNGAGALEAAVKVDGTEVTGTDGTFEVGTFTNSYEAADTSVTLKATKSLTGRNWSDGDAFTFKIEATGENAGTAPMPASDEVTATKENKTVSFGAITYESAGTWTYQVTEPAGSAGGVTYDETVYAVEVTVTDNGAGALEAAVKVDGTEVTGTDGTFEVGTFTNSYEAADTSVTLKATKSLTGRNWSDGDAFTFKIEATGDNAEDAPVPASDTVRATKTNQTVSFGAITYESEGTWTYQVTEPAGSAGGVTYDETVYAVEVTVTDNGAGALEAAVKVDGTEVTGTDGTFEVGTFTNSYEAADTSVTLKATKSLTGRNWSDGDAFTFKIEATGDNAEDAPVPVSDTVRATKTNQTVSFGAITYESAGTWTYQVTEPAGSAGGVTYDETVYAVEVTVTDNGAGALEAAVKVDGTEVTGTDGTFEVGTFTNSYEAADTSVTLKATKSLTGRNWSDGDAFTFKIEATGDNAEDAPVPASDTVRATKTNQTVSFGAITYESEGTWTYQVTEPAGSAGGVTYDETVYAVEVTVTDNGAGALEAAVKVNGTEVTGTDGTFEVGTFTNSYEAADTSVTLKATKSLTGRNWSDGDAFTFKIEATGDNAEDAPVPASDTVRATKTNQTVSFGAITYESEGTWTYQVTEPAGSAGGVTYDETVYAVEVTVTDNGAGALEAAVKVNGTEVTGTDGTFEVGTFTNSYEAADTSVTLKATKSLTGRNWSDGDAFTFKIEATGDNAEDAPVPASDTVRATKTNQTVSFGAITYESEGTWTYQVTEPAGSAGGVTYDETVYAVEVTVTDNGAGALEAAVKVNGTEVTGTDGTFEVGTFTNSYEAADTSVTLKATKSLTGRNWSDGDAFTFKIEATGDNAEDAPVPASDTVRATKTNQTVSFGAITYESEGTWTYQVTEPAGSAGGVTYDETVYAVEVTVTDNGAGALEAAVKVNGTEVTGTDGTFEVGTFTNSYEAADTSVTLKATKSLTGRNWSDGDAFTFKIEATGDNAEDAPVPASDTVRATKTNQTVSFGAITYESEGTWTYQVTEPAGSAGGVTYDETVYAVEVTVTDNGAGALEAAVKVDGTEVTGTDGTFEVGTFTNSYEAADTSVTLKATKSLTGRNWSDGDAFTFKIEATGDNAEDAPVPASDTVRATKTNQTVSFGAITYESEGTWTYQVTEPAGSAGGVTYDETVYAVEVTVTDNGAGALEAAVKVNGTEVTGTDGTFEVGTFTNSYEAADTSVTLKATKSLTGRNWSDGDAFTFKIEATGDNAEDAPVPASDTVRATKTNQTVSFGAITYESEGTWTYQVTEPAGSAGGVTYDETVYAVEVTVTDNGAGALEAAVKVNGTEVTGTDGTFEVGTFTNSYEAADTSVTLKATKSLTGRNWSDGDAFTFKIEATGDNAEDAPVPASDTVRATKTNQTVSFGAITYESEGTWTYQVTEPAGSAGGVTYDETVYAVEVTVTDNGAGALEAAVKVDGTEVTGTDGTFEVGTFTNSYEAADTSVTLKATKSLTGRNWSDGDAFTFKIEATGENAGTAPMPASDEVTATKENKTVSFGAMNYREAGTWTYKVTEPAGRAGGISYDGKEYAVKVSITDDGAGKLNAVVKVDGQTVAGENGVFQVGTFTNTYDATGSATLKGTKTISGRNFKSSDSATMKIEAVTDGAPLPESAEITVRPTEGTTAAFQFGDMSYKLSDIPEGETSKTFKYKVTESAYSMQGVREKDSTEYTVTVTISDKGDGTLNVAASDNATALDFVNTYRASGKAHFEAKKVLNGATLAKDQFTFELLDETGKVLQTKKNAEDNSVAFDDISYTEADAGKTVTYTIREQIPDGATDNKDGTWTKDSFTYDGTEHAVKVEVKDNGDGTLQITYDGREKMDTVTFTNAYKADGTTSLTAHKNLENGTLTENQFEFELLDSEGKVLQTKGNAADGSVSFDAIKYETKDAGKEFTYTIREKIPADAEKNESGNWVKGDYVYDGHTVAVTVKVTDAGNGKLETETTYEGGTATFTNTYVTTDINKVTEDGTSLSGATLRVVDGSGKTVAEWTSDGSLRQLTGLKDGEYTLTEVTAPAGYEKAADISFTMKDGKLQGFDNGVITMVDAKASGNGGGGPSGGSTGGGKDRPKRSTTPTTPTTPARTTVPDTQAVLGASRDVGREVLGAVRTKPQEVLGAVRTGDTSAMWKMAAVFLAALSTLGAWIVFFFRRRRENQ